MSTVRNMLKAKHEGRTFTVAVTDTVFDALKVMADFNISAVMVQDGEHFVGIFTERDYARKVELTGMNAKNTLVKNVMSDHLVTVTADTSVEKCMGLMMKYKFRHLPVTEGERIVGVVSIRDVMEVVLENKESVIAQLENYITGSSFAM